MANVLEEVLWIAIVLLGMSVCVSNCGRAVCSSLSVDLYAEDELHNRVGERET